MRGAITSCTIQLGGPPALLGRRSRFDGCSARRSEKTPHPAAQGRHPLPWEREEPFFGAPSRAWVFPSPRGEGVPRRAFSPAGAGRGRGYLVAPGETSTKEKLKSHEGGMCRAHAQRCGKSFAPERSFLSTRQEVRTRLLPRAAQGWLGLVICRDYNGMDCLAWGAFT